MCGCEGVHAYMVAWGHAWLPGGMHGCQGACMVAGGACIVAGGMCGCRGACMVAGGHVRLLGGHVCGCWGACMVAGGHAWWLVGDMHGCWGVCGIWRDTVNEQAVRILLECILVLTCVQALGNIFCIWCSVKPVNRHLLFWKRVSIKFAEFWKNFPIEDILFHIVQVRISILNLFLFLTCVQFIMKTTDHRCSRIFKAWICNSHKMT